MARTSCVRILASLALAGLLSACVDTGATGGNGLVPGGATARAGAEVEAPEVFQANESALWDGRPSLGGIWVASPDAKDPERVVMFNPATGKSVKGALFRRERENPGPRLQLSSDAAEALGVLAGMPTEIEVTALRKQEPVATPEAALVAAGQPSAGEDPAGTDKAAAAVAAEALDAVDESAAPGSATATGAAPEEPVKPMTWKEKRAAAKAEREAKKAAEAAAGESSAAAEAPVTPDAVTGSDIEAAPLDAGTTGPTPDQGAGTKPAVASDTAPEPAPAATGAGQGTIQIGAFSKEDNARRAIDALSKIAIVAEAKKVEKDGKVFWAVVAHGDAALLQKIKDAGFADAYFLK